MVTPRILKNTLPSLGYGKPRVLKWDAFFPGPGGINNSVNCRESHFGESEVCL